MKTILVVDDDPDIRNLVLWKLRHAGYATLAESDGKAGLAAARGRTSLAFAMTPDLVVLDWMMPGMTGLEVCQALRRDPVTAQLPVIMLTAKVQQQELEQGFAAGADDYIVKPFSPNEMLSRIEAVLTRAEPAT